MNPDDVEIQFDKGELNIRGKVSQRDDDVSLLREEYGVGDYQRRIQVGETIDPQRIAAELKHGVLTVHLPKRESLKPKRIQVTG